MGIFERLFEILDDTKEVGHNKKDNVHLFGMVAGLFTLISGIVLYIILMGVGQAEWYIRDLGLVWVLFACLDFLSLYVFEHESRRMGAKLLIVFGALGFLFGVGFFLGAIFMVFAGILAFKYSFKKIGKKIR